MYPVSTMAVGGFNEIGSEVQAALSGACGFLSPS
jgi:hypothetical protein